MKKSKKAKPRPAWMCLSCGIYWVNCDPECKVCGAVGKPLNEGAEKITAKRYSAR